MIVKGNMANAFRVGGSQPPVRPLTKTDKSGSKESDKTANKFSDFLQNELLGNHSITFSKHATERLQSRNINFDPEQLKKIEAGMALASAKGVKESFMLVEDVCLIVDVNSSTVITALDKNESKEYVFTNIDGAVLL